MLRRILTILGGLAALAAGVMIAWYQIDGQPAPRSGDYLTGPGFSVERPGAGGFVYRPKEPNGLGVVIMHGALIKPQAYTKTAAFFASRGYTVVLPYGVGRMSIAASGPTVERLDGFGLDGWFFIGHSMGGMASMEMVKTHGAEPRAVALWSGSMPADYKDVEVPILFIWGDTDGLLPPDRFAAGRANLPDHVEYVTLSGANHKNFALYTHQFFDREATLDWDAQIDFANQTSLNFFRQYHR